MLLHLCRNFLKLNLRNVRLCHTGRRKLVLGIESSCDETGAAVVDESGRVLGEGLSSQLQVHLDYGGVIPHIASYLHQENIDNVVTEAMKQTGLSFHEISAFAATVKPGLRASLKVGMDYGKQLAKKYCKPFIPVHHMEAHSLTIRMIENVPFPYLVLLASGGHCQLAVVQDVETFFLLGASQNNSPGEVLDKIARRLKLGNLKECYSMSGGQAIDYLAKDGNPQGYSFPHVLTSQRDCNFSFSGFGSYALSVIEDEEAIYDVPADGLIPNVRDFCASVLHAYAKHMMHRVQRALAFCDEKKLLPADRRTLVFSGGVACNRYIRHALSEMCDHLNCQFACPPPKLCTDNGIMVAWNGMEKLKEGVGLYDDTEQIAPEPDAPLGIDMTSDVKKASIKVRMPKLQKLLASSTS